MSEQRWIHEEGCPPDVRGTLERAGQARMDAEMRARLAHRLGPMLGPGGGGGPTSVASAGVRSSWWLWAAAGIGVIGALLAVVRTMTHHATDEPPQTANEQEQVQTEALDHEAVVSVIERHEELPATEPVQERSNPPRSNHRTRESRETLSERTTTGPEPTEVPVEVSEPSELELLTQARRLVRSDSRSAIAVLTRHATLFPRGVFAEEREVLAVEAFARSGDTRVARNRAEAFIRAHPNTAHRTRLEHFVGSLSGVH